MVEKNLEDRILERVRKTVPEGRVRHILNVIEFAEKLALAHGQDPARARLAGALHDLARCWSDRELLAYARRHRLRAMDLDFIRRNRPLLLHGPVAADLGRRRFGLRDREILSAVAKHTLAAEAMTPFEKLVFLADHLSADRVFTGVGEQRDLALRDLDRAFAEGLRNKFAYILKTGEPLHPSAIRIWNAHAGTLRRREER